MHGDPSSEERCGLEIPGPTAEGGEHWPRESANMDRGAHRGHHAGNAQGQGEGARQGEQAKRQVETGFSENRGGVTLDERGCV